MSRTATLLTLGLIAATAVYQVLERVPADALTLALGVACGVGASIPVSIGLVLAISRQRRAAYETEEDAEDEEPLVPPSLPIPHRVPAPQAQPQIIVIAPPQGQFPQGQFPQGFPYAGAHMMWGAGGLAPDGSQTVDARDWRIIGDDPP